MRSEKDIVDELEENLKELNNTPNDRIDINFKMQKAVIEKVLDDYKKSKPVAFYNKID